MCREEGFREVAFVMPAFNEEEWIGRSIKSIQKYAPGSEIVIVDNGSTDRTLEVAKQCGVNVYSKVDGTIASIRNHGVSKVGQKLIVFLDSDVTLTAQWADEFIIVRDQLEGECGLVTGSHCSPPESDNLFLRYWFKSFSEERESSHLGTGHMIMNRSFFDKVGGFDETLETGEDYEFCRRAVLLGGNIVNNTGLLVYHHDFPRTVVSFFCREVWHGEGDFGSFNGACGSRVVQASTVFLILHVMALIALFYDGSLAVFTVLLLFLLCVSSSLIKYSASGIRAVAVNSLIFYLYFCGRVSSFFVVIFKLLNLKLFKE